MTLTLWNKVSENTLQHPKPSSRVALFVALQGFKVGNNAINMKVNKELLAFLAKEEVTVLVVVHEEVFGEDAGAEGVAEEGGGFGYSMHSFWRCGLVLVTLPCMDRKVSYIVALISDFAERFGLTTPQAYRYLALYKGIDFLDEFTMWSILFPLTMS